MTVLRLARGEISYNVHFNHSLPRILNRLMGLVGANVAAVTIGPNIYVRTDTLSQFLHAHEFRHVVQAREHPAQVLYVANYLATGLIRAAVFTLTLGQFCAEVWGDHPMEKDADRFAKGYSHGFRQLTAN